MATVDLDADELRLIEAMTRFWLGGKRQESMRFRLSALKAKIQDASRIAPAPERAPVVLSEDELSELAEAALNAMDMSCDVDDWVDPQRLPDGDEADDWNGDYVRWVIATDQFREFGVDARNAVLAKLAEFGITLVREARP